MLTANVYVFSCNGVNGDQTIICAVSTEPGKGVDQKLALEQKYRKWDNNEGDNAFLVSLCPELPFHWLFVCDCDDGFSLLASCR